MIKKILDNNKELLIVTNSIVLLFIFLFVFVFKKPYILCNDQWFQYNSFYKEWIRLIVDFIKGKGLPFYSWYSYLGLDFYSSMGYYCTGDVFLPILLLFKNKVEIGLIIEEIICVNISAVSMNYLLDTFNVKNKHLKLLSSLTYAICGEASLMFGVYMYHRFYSFLPLLFTGAISLLESNKKMLMIVSSAILFLQNYYFMYPTLIVLLMFVTVWELKKEESKKAKILNIVICMSMVGLGFLISGIVTIPSMLMVFNNNRLGEKEAFSLLWDKNVYFGLYMSLVSFNPVDISGNIFHTYSSQHSYWYNMFIGILPLLGVVNYCKNKENLYDTLFLLTLFLIIIIKPLNSIMHGFSVPSVRWAFLLYLLMLLYGTKGLDLNLNKASLIIPYIFYILVFCVLLLIKFVNGVNMSQNAIHLSYIFASLLFSILIISLFFINRKVPIILSIVEIVTFQCAFFYFQSIDSYNAEDSISKHDIEYYDSLDVDNNHRYYLSYKNNNPNSSLNLNKSLDYRMMSMSSYNTMTDYSIEKFNKIAKCYDGVEWELSSNNPYANSMLGCKYYIVYNESELPNELQFEKVGNISYLQLFRNNDAKSFGFATNKLKYTKDYNNPQDFVNFIMIDDETYNISDYDFLGEYALKIEKRNNDSLHASITVDGRSVLLIPVPNNKGWRIKVNDTKIEPISVNGGFIGIPIDSGYNEIEMFFMPKGFVLGAFASFFSLIIAIILFLKDKNNFDRTGANRYSN